MPLDPNIAARFDEAAKRWDDEDEADRASRFADEPADPEPDADPDDAPVEHPMVLPEMDLSEPRPASPPAMDVPRLRAPTQTPSEPPPAAPMAPATAGAGQKDGLRVPPVEPAASLDWKGLKDRLDAAERSRGQSQAYESLFANVGARSGYKPNAHAGEADVNRARLPLELAKEQQGYESRGMAMDAQKAALGVKAADSDPNSLASQKAREALRATGLKLPAGIDNWSAADIKRFIDTGELGRLEHDRASAANAAADDAKKAAGAKEKSDAEASALANSQKSFAKDLVAMGVDPQHASQKDIDRVIQLKNAEATRALAARGQDRADNPKLPPGQVAEVADYKSAAKTADDLLAEYEASDLGGITSRATGAMSDATGADLGAVSRYNDKANTAAQGIGLALEGGKLGEADLPRYKAMMPRPGDSPERARAKRDNIKRALADKAAGRSAEWFKAGYKVPDSGDAVRMSNGKETRSVPKKHVEAARADGYNEVR